jgi:hypothetical protein
MEDNQQPKTNKVFPLNYKKEKKLTLPQNNSNEEKITPFAELKNQ